MADLFERVFELAGFKARFSDAGLIARQLIAQFGRVDAARAFKIPGVRRLIRTHGPTSTFTKKGALELIGGRDPENPEAKFSDYEQLYFGGHRLGTKLEAEAVFTHLVERGLFRIGADLKCPHCRLNTWTALDALKQQIICELCGQGFDATRQLVTGQWHYRRSGVLGAEKNAQGAIPVVLTLQQFQINLASGLADHVYTTSLELEPKDGMDLPKCEIDFAWLIRGHYPQRTELLIGECKDRGSKPGPSGSKGTFDEKDVENLRRVADAFLTKRFKTFIVLSKLSPFTDAEIALAKTLNGQGRQRVILLTAKELEPYHLYERTKLTFKNINEYASTPEGLANNTHIMYFEGKAAPAGAG